MIDHTFVDGILETWYRGSIRMSQVVRHCRSCAKAYGPTIFEIAQFADDMVPHITLHDAWLQVERNRAFYLTKGLQWTMVYVRSANPYLDAWLHFFFQKQAQHSSGVRWVVDSYEQAKQLIRDLKDSKSA